MKSKNIFNLIFINTLFIVFILGSLVVNADTGRKEITIGYFPNITHGPVIVGISEGVFEKTIDGINIKTRIFPNGSLFMDALNTGQIDLGYVGPGPALNRFLQGADVKVLASASTGGTVLITRKDLDYKSIEDLNGKVVGTAALGCTHDLLFRKMIRQHQLATTRNGGQIEHRAQKPATMVGLFATKQLDAAMVSEPWAARLEEQLGAKVVVEWDQVPWQGKLPAAVLVSRQEFIDNNPNIIKSFLHAHQKAINYIKGDLPGAALIIQKEIKRITRQELSLEIINRSLKRTNFTSKIDPAIVQQLADLSAELGFIKGSSDLEGFIDSSFLQGVASENSK